MEILLRVPRADAEATLKEREESGEQILQLARLRMVKKAAYVEWAPRRRAWVETTDAALSREYASDQAARFLRASSPLGLHVPAPWTVKADRERKAMERSLEALKNLAASLPHAREVGDEPVRLPVTQRNTGIKPLDRFWAEVGLPSLAATVGTAVGTPIATVIGLLAGHVI